MCNSRRELHLVGGPLLEFADQDRQNIPLDGGRYARHTHELEVCRPAYRRRYLGLTRSAGLTAANHFGSQHYAGRAEHEASPIKVIHVSKRIIMARRESRRTHIDIEAAKRANHNCLMRANRRVNGSRRMASDCQLPRAPQRARPSDPRRRSVPLVELRPSLPRALDLSWCRGDRGLAPVAAERPAVHPGPPPRGCAAGRACGRSRWNLIELP